MQIHNYLIQVEADLLYIALVIQCLFFCFASINCNEVKYNSIGENALSSFLHDINYSNRQRSILWRCQVTLKASRYERQILAAYITQKYSNLNFNNINISVYNIVFSLVLKSSHVQNIRCDSQNLTLMQTHCVIILLV